MKNCLIYALIGVVVVGGGIFLIKNKPKSNPLTQTNQNSQITQIQEKKEQTDSKTVDFIKEKLSNLCGLFPKEKIEEFSGRKVVNVEFKPHKELSFNQYLCRYYQEEAKYGEVSKVNIAKHIAIAVIEGEKQIKRAQEGYKMLKYASKQDKDIPFNHLMIFDEKGNFHHLDILLSKDYKLTIETSYSLLSNEEAFSFVKKLALYFKDLAENSQQKNEQTPTQTNSSTNQAVSLSQDEEIIRTFVSQINDGKADQANSQLQAWAVQFSNITSFKLLKMEKANENEWTDSKHIYKVVLDVLMDPKSADAPIPYYGWQNGENIRWLTLEKVGNTWKIAELATGP